MIESPAPSSSSAGTDTPNSADGANGANGNGIDSQGDIDSNLSPSIEMDEGANNSNDSNDAMFGIEGLNLPIMLGAASVVILCCCCLVILLLRYQRSTRSKLYIEDRKGGRNASSRPPPASIEMVNPYDNPMRAAQQTQPARSTQPTQPIQPTQTHARTKTQLPGGWAKDKDAEGNAYYYDQETGQTAWNRPPGSVQVPLEPAVAKAPVEHGRTKTQLPANWAKDKDATGASYYYHEHSGETAWNRPPGSVQVPVEEAASKSVAVEQQQHGRTKTQLPANWAKDTDAAGESYYYHEHNGETSWVAPPGSSGGSSGGALLPSTEKHGRSETVMPTGWTADHDANADKYYVDPSGSVQWAKPPGN